MKEFGLVTTGVFALLFLSGMIFLLPTEYAVGVFILFLVGLPFTVARSTS